MEKKFLGKIGEDFACRFLLNKGYKILVRNFRSKFGEIDIIAHDGETTIFVEVKTRWSRLFGRAEEAVTGHKLKRIKKVGEYFCLLNPNLSKKLRIEVVAIEIDKGKVASAKIFVAT
ncbi:MAG: hypothetical protein US96_C0018G0023 [Candidatus Woesebacteria bacterium GW2011_GWB1_38_5b]|uniref:UPF0102 protein US96_C0018G0023 n=2 Tax=Candidatus Woeseibacteriota TaxID=1752722 RepID=A0A0G0ND64_9BACT|nr:MAG: hypothetical protein US96_C0018G0023 [Candidatus Woesebacteria bacterium GW2011_GWB1_38_5b]OGM19811.1 MAG: hypothetical protein A2686_04035 [Candidatus Woesebacteria bacterium RIFCSPHIGHO2_01_FULL_38_10]OGM59461.1 MAG: hypothetical protein A2892_02330 [Candidatus Woesebacteria bacterium RIFCSPLOWO2_01_FULL_39_10b]